MLIPPITQGLKRQYPHQHFNTQYLFASYLTGCFTGVALSVHIIVRLVNNDINVNI